MAVGLWASNNSGQLLIEESTMLLRFNRKVTTTGYVSPPTASSSEVVAIRKTGWGYSGTKTYYIFDFEATPINYGLEIRDSSGKAQVSLSEGYARIVGFNTIIIDPRNVSVRRFDNYPAGTYAVMYPYLSSDLQYDAYNNSYAAMEEDFMVNSNGFLVRGAEFYYGHESEFPWYTYRVHRAKTVVLVDVAGL